MRDLPTLNVETDSAIINYGPFWYALATNEFQKNGVNVNLVTTNGSLIGLSLLASGQADLLLGNIGDIDHAVTAGVPITAVFGLDRFGIANGAIVSRPGITSLAQLKSMGTNCELGEAGPGSGLRAYAVEFERAYGITCQLDDVAGYSAEVAEATAGSLDAAALNAQDSYTLQSAGKANILLDPKNVSVADAKKMIPVNYPYLNIIGPTDDVLSPAKHTAMLDFIRTMEEASAQIQQLSSADIAQLVIQNLPNVFGTTPTSSLTPSVDLNRNLFAKASHGVPAGYITYDGWKYMLSLLSRDWIAGADPTIPGIQYRTVVNMSFVNEIYPTVTATNDLCKLPVKQVASGADIFTLLNSAKKARAFVVNGSKTKYVLPGKKATVSVTLKPGTVSYACLAPGGKKVAGGTLPVEGT